MALRRLENDELIEDVLTSVSVMTINIFIIFSKYIVVSFSNFFDMKLQFSKYAFKTIKKTLLVVSFFVFSIKKIFKYLPIFINYATVIFCTPFHHVLQVTRNQNKQDFI